MAGERFVVIDLETTSREPEEAHIIEWAAVVLEPEWFGAGGRAEHTGLVRPPIPIPPETSAVHHIIDADVAAAPCWDVESRKLISLLTAGTIAVAHSADNDRSFLAQTPLPEVPWLCTYKAALRVWPDAPAHSNEALRYYLGFGTGRRGAQAPHSALHDAQVTALILGELLKQAKLDDMLAWTKELALLPRCPIGAYRGLPWPEVPADFLEWILYKARDMREDIKFCAKTELERRQKAAAQSRVVVGADEDDEPF